MADERRNDGVRGASAAGAGAAGEDLAGTDAKAAICAAPARPRRRTGPVRVIPGFGLMGGITLTALSLIGSSRSRASCSRRPRLARPSSSPR